jgi:hypothetical protein
LHFIFVFSSTGVNTGGIKVNYGSIKNFVALSIFSIPCTLISGGEKYSAEISIFGKQIFLNIRKSPDFISRYIPFFLILENELS